MITSLSGAVTETVRRGAFPVVLGGDHFVAYPAARGFVEALIERNPMRALVTSSLISILILKMKRRDLASTSEAPKRGEPTVAKFGTRIGERIRRADCDDFYRRRTLSAAVTCELTRSRWT